jgi:hypothetical protein
MVTTSAEKNFRARAHTTPRRRAHRSISSRTIGGGLNHLAMAKNMAAGPIPPRRHGSFHQLEDDGVGLTTEAQDLDTSAGEIFALSPSPPPQLLTDRFPSMERTMGATQNWRKLRSGSVSAPNPDPIIDSGNVGGVQFSEASIPFTHSLPAATCMRSNRCQPIWSPRQLRADTFSALPRIRRVLSGPCP